MAETDADQDYDVGLSREFYLLRDEVYDRLSRAANVPNARWYRVGQLLVVPAFDNPLSWDVLTAQGGQYILYRTCWRLDLDYAVFESRADRSRHPTVFVPTIEVAAVQISSELLQELLGAFDGVSIPVGLPTALPYEDDIEFELLVGGVSRCCRLHWCGDVPQAWEPLRPIIRRMAESFEAAWSSRGT